MAPRTVTLRHRGHEHRVDVGDDGVVDVGGRRVATERGPDGTVRIGSQTAWTAAAGDTRWVFVNGRTFEFAVARPGGRGRAGTHHGSLTAPMPATVRRIAVEAGQRVSRGDTLIVLEAMKMELPVRAAADGVVEKICCAEGDLVQPGVTLIELDEG